MSSCEIKASFKREHRVFLNDDGSRVIIAEAELADRSPVTLNGDAAEGALKPGLVYRFYGRWFEHHKFGRQFKFASFVEERPAGQRAVTVYLQQCKGIGTVVAKRLWDEYGDGAVEILRTQPRHVARMTSGLTEETALAAAEFLERREATERSRMDILELLKGHGFPRKLPDWLLRDFGSAAADRVRENPYLLLRYSGCGFGRTDNFYLALGKPAARLKRQALCCWNSVFRGSNGDTWVCSRELRDALEKSIAAADVETDKAIRLACRARLLRMRRDAVGTTWFAEEKKAKDEERVARYVAEVMEEQHG